MKKIFIRLLYLVEGKVFNVGEKGQKTVYDGVAKRAYGFASSENVKKCMKHCFADLIEESLPQMFFTKKKKNSDTDGEQGGMFTRFNVNDRITPIFGAWHSEINIDEEENKKYSKFAVSSCFSLTQLAPVHILLQSLTDEDCGVCRGDDAPYKIVIKEKVDKNDTLFFSPTDKITIEDFAKRPMNLYKTPRYCNGLYMENVSLEIERFGLYDLNEFCPTEEEKKWLIEENGWEEIKIGRKTYIGPNRETRVKLYHKFCEMLTDWEFETNNSTNGGRCELIRCSASLNARHLEASTMGEKVSENEAELILRDIDDVQSFNLPTLRQVKPNTETDIYAAENFVEYLKSLDTYIR